MNCATARLLIGAAPAGTTAQLEEHLAGCAECTRFRQEMQSLKLVQVVRVCRTFISL